MDQFIIVNKKTGRIMTGKQGVYRSLQSANKALGYWSRGASKDDYSIINLEPKTLLTLIK